MNIAEAWVPSAPGNAASKLSIRRLGDRWSVGLVAATAAALTTIPVLMLVFWHGVRLPTGDEWDLAKTLLYLARNGFDFDIFTAFHNEHRIIIPRLYFWVISLISGWDTLLIKVVNALLVVGTAALSCSLIATGIRAQSLAIGTSLIFILRLGNWDQWQNFLWSFQFPWFLIPLLLVASSHALLVSPGPTTPGRLLASLYCLIASACMASGVLTWLSIIPLWLRGARRTRDRLGLLSLWGLLFLLSVCFTLNWRGASSGEPRGTLGSFVMWFLCLLGQPFVSCVSSTAGALPPPVTLAIICGLILIGWTVWGLYIAFVGRRGEERAVGRLHWFSLALLIYGFSSALIISWGRFSMGFEMAAQSRYITFTQYSFLGILLLTAANLDRARIEDGGPGKMELKSFRETSLFRVYAVRIIGFVLLSIQLLPPLHLSTWLNDLSLAHRRLRAVLSLADLDSVRPELAVLAHNQSVDDFNFLLSGLETTGLLRPPRLQTQYIPLSAISTASSVVGNVDITPAGAGRYEGWAAFSFSGIPVDAVVAVRVKDDRYFSIVSVSEARRIHREDVAKALRSNGARLAGWELTVPPDGGAAGQLIFLALDASTNTFYRF